MGKMSTLDEIYDELELIGEKYAEFLEEAEETGASVLDVAGQDSLEELRDRLTDAIDAAEGRDLDIYNRGVVLFNAVSSALNEG